MYTGACIFLPQIVPASFLLPSLVCEYSRRLSKAASEHLFAPPTQNLSSALCCMCEDKCGDTPVIHRKPSGANK